MDPSQCRPFHGINQPFYCHFLQDSPMYYIWPVKGPTQGCLMHFWYLFLLVQNRRRSSQISNWFLDAFIISYNFRLKREASKIADICFNENENWQKNDVDIYHLVCGFSSARQKMRIYVWSFVVILNKWINWSVIANYCRLIMMGLQHTFRELLIFLGYLYTGKN